MPDTKAYELKVYQKGSGCPVVFIHGFISTHRYWQDVLEQLDFDKVQAIRLDLLGFGASPRPRMAEYTVEQQVACIHETLKSIKLKKPYIVVGHSIGAIIALQFMHSHRNEVSDLILSSLPLLTEENLKNQTVTLANKPWLLKNRWVVGLAFRLMHAVSYIPKKLARIFVLNVPKHVADDTTKHSPVAYRKILKNTVFAEKVLRNLETTPVKTTCLIGRDDAMIADIDTLRAVCETQKNITAIEVDSDHQIPLDSPKLVADTIMRIIASNK